MNFIKTTKRSIYSLLILGILTMAFAACSDEEEATASVSINSVGSDFGGDVVGNGGSTTQSFTWNNPLATADYNMDITAVAGGNFQLTITDSDGATVLNQSLTKGQGDDSRSGVTEIGSSGNWTITITLTNFAGDGSFSLSPGN
ncbi:hypothetical protein QQ008_15380 [Fulvivirgaceae bacterium BMA10]|uniref:Uncharacterized protein n=1 Tax=Splendidivirga corallicola TaxID=3051826 RepID=A0ABT8KTF9_9BACT|nr:hypothetical protein [Fulvivirgaceae bacterium BMA10]